MLTEKATPRHRPVLAKVPPPWRAGQIGASLQLQSRLASEGALRSPGCPGEECEVSISGPASKQLKTSESGEVKFTGLPPGAYTMTAKYNAPNKLVDEARKYDGNTDWALMTARNNTPVGVNNAIFTFMR